MTKLKPNFKVLVILLFSLILINCGSEGGGSADTSTESPTPTTTIVEHNFMFYTSCEGGCSAYDLYQYSFDDQVASKVGAGVITDIKYGGDKYYPMTAIHNGKIYFSATDGSNGYEFWVYDPSLPETVGENPKMIADIASGALNSNPRYFTVIQNKIYFQAATSASGTELWVYEPSEPIGTSNPQMLADLNPGTGNSNPQAFTELNGKIYLRANDGTNGDELMVYDPVAAVSGSNPQIIANIAPGPSNSNIAAMAVHNDQLYFRADDSTNGSEPWIYDPAVTVSGTNPKMLFDLFPGAAGANPYSFTSIGNYVIFRGYQSTLTGHEAWVYDPNQAILIGTNPFVMDLYPGGTSSLPSDFHYSNGKVYFPATTASNGQELWVFDPSQTVSVGTNPYFVDTNPGLSGGSISSFTNFNGKVYHNALGADTEYKLSEFDPTQPINNWGTDNPLFLTTNPVDYVYDIMGLSYSETIAD